MQSLHRRGRRVRIQTAAIGSGVERICYVHPDDDSKAIKISVTQTKRQSKREVRYYEKLLKRSNVSFEHLPRYYGRVRTNLGDGFVVDLVRDFDGSVSQSLEWHFENGLHYTRLPPYLDEFKDYFLRNRIIFNYDMTIRNVLFQRCTPDKPRLVMIDGLGDTVAIKWLNRFSAHVRSKIERRFDRFLKKLYKSEAILRQKDDEQHVAFVPPADILPFPQPVSVDVGYEVRRRCAA